MADTGSNSPGRGGSLDNCGSVDGRGSVDNGGKFLLCAARLGDAFVNRHHAKMNAHVVYAKLRHLAVIDSRDVCAELRHLVLYGLPFLFGRSEPYAHRSCSFSHAITPFSMQRTLFRQTCGYAG
ncbi:MAG: hypothetical protein J1E60_07820 [Christensenellaceae bacterium]|nr:hypothetical protein [Christensenellaceae bacterium]